jgi:HPt (histidine-containing phosphotransfer) domain-containing protein
MNRQFDISLSPRAYRFYVKELDEGLARVTQIILTNQDVDPQLASEFGILFHKVRGGAGFFGLDLLADVAGRLEELFFEGEEELLKKYKNIETLIHELNELATNLPRPAEQDSSGVG